MGRKNKLSDEDQDLVCQLVNERRSLLIENKKLEIKIKENQIAILRLSNANIGAKFGCTASVVTHITRNLATEDS